MKKASSKVDQSTKIQKPGIIEKYSAFIVFSIAFLLYASTLSFDFTYLDDTIFVRDFSNYHQFSNFFTFFKRGLFDAVNDSYYRPLLSLSFTIDTFFGDKSLTFFRFSNLLIHAFGTLLVFIWLQREFNDVSTGFALSILFAVHPAFVQVAAWIPGRNDALLMLFFMLHLLQVQLWLKDKKTSRLFYIFTFLVLAFFTKETAYFIPFITAIYVWMHKENVTIKQSGFLTLSVMASTILFFFIRSNATLKHDQIGLSDLLQNVVRNFPVLFQYLGKTLFPVNLTVFPTMQNTDSVYGYIAILIFTAAAVFCFIKYKSSKAFIGLLWFAVLISPALLVPKSLNDQTFEHRLYLPFTGILFLIAAIVQFWSARAKNKFYLTVALIVTVFTIINFSRQKVFANDVVFWEDAVSGSPDNAYANMLLGVRYTQKNRLPEAYKCFGKAYSINPEERYINHYMGLMYLNNKQAEKSIPYFEKDNQLKGLYESYFHLARAYFETGNKSGAISALESYINLRPSDGMANNNLMLLYSEAGDIEKLKKHIQKMQQNGLQVPPEMLQKVTQ